MRTAAPFLAALAAALAVAGLAVSQSSITR